MGETYQTFSQRFDFNGLPLDVDVKFEFDDDNWLPYELTFVTSTFRYSMTDIGYESFINKFLYGYSYGGNSNSYICKSTCGTYYEVGNMVSGSGGDSEFSMRLSADLMKQIRNLLVQSDAKLNQN